MKTVYKVTEYYTNKEAEYEAKSRDGAMDLFVEEFYPEDKKLSDAIKSGLTTKYVSGFLDKTKTIRCTKCSTEYSDYEVEGAKRCIECGDIGIPMAISEDVNIKINWHELRILTIWAENWARQCDKNSKEENEESQLLLTIMCVAQRLQKQFPDKTPLTLFGEIRELRKEYKLESDLDDDKNLF